MNLSPPSSQKAADRPISFLLDDQSSGASFGRFGQQFVDLVIRPEDLTRTDPSRLATQQTLGGAWVDSFGAGVSTINISGHTGWRRTESSDDDGLARFKKLKEQVFSKWHDGRADAAATGRDPDGVKLIFTDALDDFSVTVAPVNFVLRRNKQRPLLCQYQISMVVLEDASIDGGFSLKSAGLDSGILESLGLGSLEASVNRLVSMAVGVSNYVNGSIAVPVRDFMEKTARLYKWVQTSINSANGIAKSLIGVAQLTAQAGYNLFRTLATVVSIPAIARAQLMQVAGAYTNIFCVLKNALRQQVYYQDYSAIYGASNCSSTSGGRPVSSLLGTNPFFGVVPTTTALPVSVSAAAGAGLSTIAYSDPVLAPLSNSDIGSAINAVSGGLVVS